MMMREYHMTDELKLIARRKANEETLMSLADGMAAAAASFSSHGYDVFIRSREEFKETLCKLFTEDQNKKTF